MGSQGILALGVLLGLLVAVGLVAVILRGGREQRKPLLVALIVVLVLTAGGGGVVWARMGSRLSAPAPVNANLTLFTQGFDCAKVTGDCSFPNALYAVRADNGLVRWEVVEPQPAYFIGLAPLFNNGVVYAYIYPGPSATVGSLDNYLLAAWRARDGKPLWQTHVLAQCCAAPMTFVAGDEVAVLGASVEGSAGPPAWGFVRLRASDGVRVGVTPLQARNFPAVVDDMVYQCLPNDTVTAMRLSDGAQVWSSPASDPAAQSFPSCAVTAADGMIFVSLLAGNGSIAGRTGELVALNASNGQALWRYATPRPDPLAVGDGLVALGEGNQYAPSSIVALRASSGTVAWRHRGFPPIPTVRGGFPNYPGAIGGGLALVSEGFTLWALRTDNGNVAWQITADRHSYQTVGIVHGTIFVRVMYVGSGFIFPLPFVDGNSYFSALRASDGAPYWQTPMQTVEFQDPAIGGA